MKNNKSDDCAANIDMTQIKSSVATGSWATYLEQVTGQPLELRTKQACVYILIDCSGSMGDNNKLVYAQNGARQFAKQAINKGYSVGIISFSQTSRVHGQPTQDESMISQALNEISIASTTYMSTPIRLAIRELEERKGTRVIYLVTDGFPNDPEATLTEAQRAKKLGIEIMTLGTQDANGAFLIKLSTKSELSDIVQIHKLESSMKQMAALLPAPKSDR